MASGPPPSVMRPESKVEESFMADTEGRRTRETSLICGMRTTMYDLSFALHCPMTYFKSKGGRLLRRSSQTYALTSRAEVRCLP